MRSVRDIPPRAAAVVIALALIAGIVTGREQAPPPQAAAPATPPAAEPPTQQPDLALDKLVRRRTEHAVQDLFATPSWAPPVAPAPPATVEPAAIQPSQPAVPAAPPLPFTYLGRMVKNDRTLVYLLKGDDMLLAESGQTLGEYRVEAIGDSTMTFVYAPSGTPQTLAFPAKD